MVPRNTLCHGAIVMPRDARGRFISESGAYARVLLAESLVRMGCSQDKVLSAIGYPVVAGWSIAATDGREHFALKIIVDDEVLPGGVSSINSAGKRIHNYGRRSPLAAQYLRAGAQVEAYAPAGWLRCPWSMIVQYSGDVPVSISDGSSEQYDLYFVGGNIIGACGPQYQRSTRSQPPWTLEWSGGGSGSLEAAAYIGDTLVAYANKSASGPSITFGMGNGDTNPALGWCYKEAGESGYAPRNLRPQVDRENGRGVIPSPPGWPIPDFLRRKKAPAGNG